MRIQVMTFPFGACGARPASLLDKSRHEVYYMARRVRHNEVTELVTTCDAIIAGTEPYTKEILDGCLNLRIISRVGVGVDNIDLAECDARGIVVTYTPEAPADGVAELAVAQILNLLRKTRQADQSIRSGKWDRAMGTLVSENRIGILGVGRIGKRVIRLLQPFNPTICGCDLKPDEFFSDDYRVEWMTIGELFAACNLISIHVPLNEQNWHLVGCNEIFAMKRGSYLINTSRGPVVHTGSVVAALRSGPLAGYAADVFEDEPYRGTLINEPNTFLTPHIGSCARESRYLMELRAVQDCLNVLAGGEPFRPVPAEMRDGYSES